MKYIINLKQYEGPMDLLLDLIKKNKINIYNIPIHSITIQFLEYLNLAEKINLELSSDFIVMASTLLEIKSKILLPKIEIESDEENDAKDEDPRKELVQRILEYKKYKDISKTLKEAELYEAKAFYKLRDEIILNDYDKLPDNLDISQLYTTFKNLILKTNKNIETVQIIKTDNYTIEICSKNILNKLNEKGNIWFSSLISYKEIDEIITYFLSMLELIKNSEISIKQNENFQDINIYKRIKK